MKFFLITFGCQMNLSDSERIRGVLKELDCQETNDRKKASLAIINTCHVRQSAENRAFGLIHNLRKHNPHTLIILTGCMAKRMAGLKESKEKVDHCVEIHKLPSFLKKRLKGKSLSKEKIVGTDSVLDFFDNPPLCQSKYSAYVPIMTGCNNFCSYCVVPYSRGREVSREPQKIINEIKTFVLKGYSEIILLGQNVNSYLPPNNKLRIKDFPDLLEKIAQITGNFWIRFITSHPKDMSDKLIDTVAKKEKITNYFHLPVQAGSDRILKSMQRGYSVQKYLNLLKKIKSKVKNPVITTDIIVGFPGEKKIDFAKTANLMRKVGFDMAYISQYSPRPQTKAWYLPDSVSLKEKKDRKLFLTKILEKTSQKNSLAQIGRITEAMFFKEAKNFYRGRTKENKNIIIKKDSSSHIKFGEIYKIKITGAQSFGLKGTLKY